MRQQLAAEHLGNEQLHLMKAAMLWGNLMGFGFEFCSSWPCVTASGLFSSSGVSVLRPWDFREAGGTGQSLLSSEQIELDCTGIINFISEKADGEEAETCAPRPD